MNMFFSIENWESDVRDVQIEACAAGEDPLGYRVVFFLNSEHQSDIAFRVGASSLHQRVRRLAEAGYNAPMTKKAITMIESRINCGTMDSLPV